MFLYNRFFGNTPDEEQKTITKPTVSSAPPFSNEEEVQAWYKEAKIPIDSNTDSLTYKTISWEQLLSEIDETRSEFNSFLINEKNESALKELLLWADQLIGGIHYLQFHYENDDKGDPKNFHNFLLQFQTKLCILSERTKTMMRAMKELKNTSNEKLNAQIKMISDELIALREQIKKDGLQPPITPNPSFSKA